ncbi:MAG: citrate synthase [Kiritimatiellia bacterium]|jgi:citrate synthase
MPPCTPSPTNAPFNEAEHFERLCEKAASSCLVDSALYARYNVKRGLRDLSGSGVLAGLTQIGDVQGQTLVGEANVPGPGRLIYRGIDIDEIVEGFYGQGRTGFEETAYLLLFGDLPNAQELDWFLKRLASERALSHDFIHDSILTLASPDIMNAMAQTVLSLYVLDKNPDDTSIPNVLRQSLFLVANFPLIAAYCYRAHIYRFDNRCLIIRPPRADFSTAGNFLHMLRDNGAFTPLEERLLDLSLVLHAEHGGGNNSSFTTHVVTSTGTDTYSAITAALGALKGPRHGGANIKVVQMIDDLKDNVEDWTDAAQVERYLQKLLAKEAFDHSGLIYGIGHAVYSISDPRTELLRKYVRALAKAKDMEEEIRLYETVETLAPALIGKNRKMYKGVSANVDFYSGLLYRLLDIPPEVFTPLFAVSRIVGWCAHRIEELANNGKIIRPAYLGVAEPRHYQALEDRR